MGYYDDGKNCGQFPDTMNILKQQAEISKKENLQGSTYSVSLLCFSSIDIGYQVLEKRNREKAAKTMQEPPFKDNEVN